LDVDVQDFETAGADAIFIKPLKAEYLDRVLAYIAAYGSASDHFLLHLSPTSTSKSTSKFKLFMLN
jgi:hypothetical protein